MNEVRTAMERPPDTHPVEFVDEPPPPSFGDAIRYVWERRVRLTKTPTGSTVVLFPERKTP